MNRTVVDGPRGAQTLVTQMNAAARGLAPARSWDEIKGQAPGIIFHSTQQMVELLEGHDVFDVLELFRMFELSGAARIEGEDEVLAALLDIVALAAIGIGNRIVSGEPAEATASIIPKLRRPARDLSRLATLLAYALREDPTLGPMGELAGDLRSSELMIRVKHYDEIAEQLNSGVLGTPKIERILESTLGFTYRDIRAIRAAMRDIYAEKKNSLAEQLHSYVQRFPAGHNMPPEERERASQIAADFISTPGSSASFTAQDIADRTGLGADRVAKVLECFSVRLGSLDKGPKELIEDFVGGRNALAGMDLIADNDGNYLRLQNGIPNDHVRRHIEALLKDKPEFETYHKNRDKAFAEVFAQDRLAALLSVGKPTYPSLKYYAPSSGRSTGDLNHSSTDPARYGRGVESDALFVIDDVAICLEVKAGSIRDGGRGGDTRTLARDLQKIVTEATEQAVRLKQLILDNGGLWLKNRSWLDLSHVREVHTIVACLDDFGPLGIAADALVRSGVIAADSIPWIVSLHDLAVVGQVLEHPASFLLYLRRRTEPLASRLFVAVDELDVLMWFVKGGLYFEHDPERLHDLYPMSSPPSAGDIKRFRKQRTHRIYTMTDDLDAWMHSRGGPPELLENKPIRRENDDIARLVEFLREKTFPGWLTIGADLFNLSAHTQKNLVRLIHTTISRTKIDHQHHTGLTTYLTPWGYTLIFVGTQPSGEREYLDHLQLYVRAKKHQLRADRAFAMLVDESGSILSAQYLNDPYAPDEELDRLGEEMGLIDPRSRGALTDVPRDASPRSHKRRTTKKKRKKR